MAHVLRPVAAPAAFRFFSAALLLAGLFGGACDDDSSSTPDGASSSKDASADAAAADASAVTDGAGTGADTSAIEDGSGGDAIGALGGCVDRVGSDNHVATLLNSPNGTCDTYGSFTLSVPVGGQVNFTHATFFRTDQTGTNAGASAGHFNRGVWTSEAGAQNVPNNYVAHLFIATTANPGPGDFVPLGAPLSSTVSLAGEQTFYFFADGDDQAGGNYGFGLNLWFASAGAAAPALSTFVAVPGGTFMADGTTGCSPAFDGTCTTSANTLSATAGTSTVTLSAFTVAGLGGGSAPVDAGTSD